MGFRSRTRSEDMESKWWKIVPKRVYFITPNHDDEEGIAVVCNSSREARKNYWDISDAWEFTEARVKWMKHINPNIVEKLPYGEVDPIDGLKCGIYDWVVEECEMCGECKEVYYDEQTKKILCSPCIEKMVDKEYGIPCVNI